MANTFLSCSLIILDKQEKTPNVSLFITWGVEDLFKLKINKNYYNFKENLLNLKNTTFQIDIMNCQRYLEIV